MYNSASVDNYRAESAERELVESNSTSQSDGRRTVEPSVDATPNNTGLTNGCIISITA